MTQTVSNDGHKKAVVYTRVSTDEQASNYSLRTQIEACRKYAKNNGFTIVGNQYFDLKENKVVSFPNENTEAAYADDFTGTVPIEERPEGKKAYQLLSSGAADALIAYDLSRIMRPPEENQEWLFPPKVMALAQAAKEIHTVQNGQIKTDFVSLLMAVLELRESGKERRTFIRRSKEARRTKAESGRVVGGGYAPYGYKFSTERVLNPKTGLWRDVVTGFEILPAEAEVAKMIYTWYAFGTDDDGPMSASAIAQRLSQNGITSPGATRNGKRFRAATIWNYSVIARILQSETYAGVWRFGKQDGDKNKGRKLRPVAEQIVVTIPAIVDRKTWEATQVRLAHNREQSFHNRATHDYLLRGRIKCVCGRSMTGTFVEQYRYYRCTWKKTRYKGIEDIPCNALYANADVIEAGVWDIIYTAMTGDPEQFERDLRVAQALQEKQAKPKVDELQTVLSYLAESEKEADEIAQAIRKAKGAVAASLERQQDECNKRYDALTRRRDELQAELAQRTLTDETIDETLQFRADVSAGLKEPTNDDVRFYYKQLNVKVTVDGDLVTVKYDVPTGAVRTFSKNDYCTGAGGAGPARRHRWLFAPPA